MTPERVEEIKSYIEKHVVHLDKYMRPMFDPRGKRVLVIGSGWGTETYWCLLNGATEVVGADPAERPTIPLVELLKSAGANMAGKFTHHEGIISDLPASEFDAIISNNVFEHIFDLRGTFESCRRFMKNKNSRLHIFTDPLYYSSVGAHLPTPPWNHLKVPQEVLKASLPKGANWSQFTSGLNKMTITSFLDAVRQSGMWIENLSIISDRNRRQYLDLAPGKEVAPMDALLEGIACTLGFPENV